MVQKIGLERLKLSFYMNDICKFSSIKVERGLDYPFARTMSFALSATFCFVASQLNEKKYEKNVEIYHCFQPATDVFRL